jgi:hypothetical protein
VRIAIAFVLPKLGRRMDMMITMIATTARTSGTVNPCRRMGRKDGITRNLIGWE